MRKDLSLREGRLGAGQVSSAREWIKSNLSYRPFLVLLGLGIFVRLAAVVMYSPAWMQALDEVRFARISPTGIFSDYWSPAGYAIFARGMRAVFPQLWVTVAVQHVIGLGLGICLYLAMRRLGAKPWLACVPAAVAFLSGDQVWIEHQVVAETFMTTLIAAGLASAVRGLVPVVDLRWLGVASALLMYAGLSRQVGLVALPVFVLCVALWVRGDHVTRLRAVAASLLPALLVFGLYFAAFEISGGKYLGISDMSGWNLYARVAPFADCHRFTPPAGTRRLCESTVESERDASLGYSWDPSTRGRQMYPLGPATDAVMGSFARAVILNQPLSYLRAVATDAARFIDPSIGPNRPYAGLNHEIQSFGHSDPEIQNTIEELMSEGYGGAHVTVHGRGILRTYQDVFRVSGLMVAALVVLTLIGAVIAKGWIRLGVFLFGLTGLLLYLVPAATLSYEVRYGIPPLYFITASGTLGLAALVGRRMPGAVFNEVQRVAGLPDGEIRQPQQKSVPSA